MACQWPLTLACRFDSVCKQFGEVSRGGEMRIVTRISFWLLLASAAMWAQTSQINGIVKDSTGAAIPGAAIKATQTATGVVRTTISGTDGGYVLPNLAIGPYLMEVSKDGFNKFAQS